MSDKLIDVKIEINADQLMKSLHNLQERLSNRSVILKILGNDVVQWSRERIESGKNRGPDGSVWAALKKSTVRNKARKGLEHRGILQRYLDLTSSIKPGDPTEDSVSVGSRLVYALIHQSACVDKLVWTSPLIATKRYQMPGNPFGGPGRAQTLFECA